MDNLSIDELDFLAQSNYIENERSSTAFKDAIKAWKYLKHQLINIDNILWVHKLLMQGIRPDIAGKWRNCDVWINGNQKVFISQDLISKDIDSLCNSIIFTEHKAGLSEKGDRQVAKNLHIEFEYIHPFKDGNGRVGRIIYNAHRLRLGLPLHIIHEGEEQMEYYKWFK